MRRWQAGSFCPWLELHGCNNSCSPRLLPAGQFLSHLEVFLSPPACQKVQLSLLQDFGMPRNYTVYCFSPQNLPDYLGLPTSQSARLPVHDTGLFGLFACRIWNKDDKKNSHRLRFACCSWTSSITLKVSPLDSLPFNDFNILQIQPQLTPSLTSIVGVNQLVETLLFVLSTRSHVLQSPKKGLLSTWSSTIASETLPWSAFKGATLLDWLRLISAPNVCRSYKGGASTVGPLEMTRHTTKEVLANLKLEGLVKHKLSVHSTLFSWSN